VSSGFHPSIEQYLETLYDLNEDGDTIIQARLAERLKHSAPTVSAVVKKLEQEGDIVKTGRNLQLTEKGLQRAQSVVRKHRLAERLLTDILGIEWHLVHEEAGLLEHVISERVEQKIIQITGNPSTCPHGNPIPGHIKRDTLKKEYRLTEANSNTTYRISRIGEILESSPPTLKLLYDCGVVPDNHISVISNSKAANKHDYIKIKTKKGINAIKLQIAQQLWISNLA
jgi:DtxR family Mn-dependent transcriptional regulator